MSICTSGCGGTVPEFTVGCEYDVRPGGADRLIIFNCEATIDDWTSQTEWESLRDAGDVRFSMPAIIEKPETETAFEVVDGCGTEAITSEIHNLNVTFKITDNENLTEFDYHNSLRDDYKQFKIGWIDCNDVVFLNPDVDTSLKDPGFDWWWTQWPHIIPATNQELQSFPAIIRFRRRTIVKGRYVPFLRSVLG